MIEPLFSVTAQGFNEKTLEIWAVDFLRKKEWIVERVHDWETPKEVSDRLGISSAHMSSTMRDARCPKPFDVIKGKTGRTIFLQSTSLLEQFLTKHKNGTTSKT